ncbi:ABC transporter permease [Rhodoflexus caldus]|uniref:ABC transporter permease n=1 Tax=Rhodoflexus caldus TaxID=2891236 RepID=UPI00202A98DB|nr:ABC transporter permease [Rhodoflexus caldus]
MSGKREYLSVNQTKPLKEEELQNTPSYYVRQKLKGDVLAMASLSFIIFAALLGIFAYFIMPDHTPNANESMSEIRKQYPLFRAKIVKIAVNNEPKETTFWQRLMEGAELQHKAYAVSDFRLANDSVFIRLYVASIENIRNRSLGITDNTANNEPAFYKPVYDHVFSLVDATRAVYPLPSDKLGAVYPGNFYVVNDTVTYLDINEKIQKESISRLRSEFLQKNVEERTFYLGTDRQGRDMLSKVILGTRISLLIGIASVMISLFLGVVLGALAGYFGGITDHLIMWLMTVVWSIPSIMLVIAIRIALGSKGLWVVFVAVGLTTWVEIARVVRGEILAIKEKLYIEAARAFGYSHWRIIYHHILPNIFGSIIVLASSNFATAIILEAGMSFLGIGVQIPAPSWGNMIYEAYATINSLHCEHLIIIPCIGMGLLVLAFNFLGNGLRDAYDPKVLVSKNK